VYDSCAQRYAHKYEQLLNSCLVGVRLVFVCFKGFLFLCVFVGKGLRLYFLHFFVFFCILYFVFCLYFCVSVLV